MRLENKVKSIPCAVSQQNQLPNPDAHNTITGVMHTLNSHEKKLIITHMNQFSDLTAELQPRRLLLHLNNEQQSTNIERTHPSTRFYEKKKCYLCFPV